MFLLNDCVCFEYLLVENRFICYKSMHSMSAAFSACLA